MAQLCTNAPPITNSALNGSHLHQCLLTHSECTQPTLASMPPYTLRMHSTNSNQVLYESNVHKYTLITQSRLTMLDCTSNASKYLQRAPIQNLCASKLQMASKTSKLLQDFSKFLQGSKKHLQEPSRSENLHLQQTQNLKISFNAHKQSNL